MQNIDIKKLISDQISTASALLFPESKLALFYSPKAGATSLINWYHFQKNLQQFQCDSDIRNNAGNTELMIAYQSSRPYQAALGDLRKSIYNGEDGDWKLIKLVRDPYKRGVSAFYMVMLLSNTTLSLREFFKLPLSYFTTFGDGHCSPQVTNLEKLNILKFDRLIKLEDNFIDELRKIEIEFELKLGFESINLHANKRNTYDTLDSTISAADIVFTSKQIQDKKSVPSFSLYAEDDDLLASIYAKYTDDFSFYNYPTLHSQSALETHYRNQADYKTPRMKRFFDDKPQKSLATFVSELEDDEEVVVYGAGQIMFELIYECGLIEKNVVAIIENNSNIINQWRDFFKYNMRIPLLKADSITTLTFDKIIITPLAEALGIRNQLLSLKIPREKIILLPEAYK